MASILIVERNRFVRHMLRDVLEKAGYQVSAVATTPFARLLLTSHGESFDLVLFHVRSLEGDNIGFCDGLRTDGFDRPIMILSEDAAELRDAVQAGASAWLQTPFAIEALLRQIETMLKQHGSKAMPVLHRPRFHSASR